MLTPKEIAYQVTKALDTKKGMDIKLLKIDRVSSLADYFLICTGTSNTHVKTLCDYAEYTLEQLGEPTSLPRKPGHSMPWSGCGQMPRSWIFPKSSSPNKKEIEKQKRCGRHELRFFQY